MKTRSEGSSRTQGQWYALGIITEALEEQHPNHLLSPSSRDHSPREGKHSDGPGAVLHSSFPVPGFFRLGFLTLWVLLSNSWLPVSTRSFPACPP